MKRFEIVITEIAVETKISGKNWERKTADPNSEYGYTPEIKKQVQVSREVYKQNTDSLDLVEVIKAVNKIG